MCRRIRKPAREIFFTKHANRLPPADLHLSFITPRWRNFHRECSWQPNLQHPTLISFLKIHSLSLCGEENATLPFPVCSPKADCGPEQFIITPALRFSVFPSRNCSCLSCGHCDKNQMRLNLSILPVAVWGERQLETLFRTENYLKLLEDFQEWGLECNGSSVVVNC